MFRSFLSFDFKSIRAYPGAYACGPWMQALLRQMLRLPSEAELPLGLRFVVIDASTIQAPGATGIDYRLHISMALVTLEFIEILVTDVHTGEALIGFQGHGI